MGFLPEQNTFDPVYQLEKSDFVLGGVGGKSNVPLQNLTNRTAYLKEALESLESGGGPFEYNASAGTLPVGGSDGPGVDGIRRKDYYFVTVPGTVMGVTLQAGDALIAKTNDADDILDFIVSQSNAELGTPTVIGMVKLVQNLTGGSQADAVLSVAGLINLFAQKNSPTFTGAPQTTTPDASDNSQQIANTAWVIARMVALAGEWEEALGAEILARQNGDGEKANKNVTISTSEGIEGGGDLTASRSLKLTNGGVTNAKLATNSVSEVKIQDNAVTFNKLNGTQVRELFYGSGLFESANIDFRTMYQTTEYTYGPVGYGFTYDPIRKKPFVKFRFLLRTDSESDVINIYLQRKRLTDFSWTTIFVEQRDLRGGTIAEANIEKVDVTATGPESYQYRCVVQNQTVGNAIWVSINAYVRIHVVLIGQ